MPLDIAAGFLGAIVYSLVIGEDLTFPLLALGAVFALLPDVDFIVSWARKGSLRKVDHTHRDLLHYPLPFLLAGGAIVFWLAPDYLWLFLGLGLFHFAHDSVGTGWGIPWLVPFSTRYFQAFRKRSAEFSWTDAVFWRHAERDAAIARLHDPDWIRTGYQRISFTLLVEGVAFLVMLGLAAAATRWL